MMQPLRIIIWRRWTLTLKTTSNPVVVTQQNNLFLQNIRTMYNHMQKWGRRHFFDNDNLGVQIQEHSVNEKDTNENKHKALARHK